MPTPDLLDHLSKRWRAWALIALISLAGAIPGVFSVPPLDRDEARFAQATAQMLETGDYVRIAVQDQPRNKKPVGIYWAQALSVALTSAPEAREIWAYRLPSVAGALLAALAAFWGGAALVGRRAALLGACLFASCLLIGAEAMIAKTDAMLCGLVTLAMAALARLRVAGSHAARALPLVFWTALGAGILIKGPVAPLAAAGALAALYAWERRAAWMKPLARWPGPVLCVLIVLPWAVAIWNATDGQFFRDAIGGDLAGKIGGGDEGHGGPPLYHAALVWLLLFPAAIALPAGLRLFWRAGRAARNDDAYAGLRFLAAWAAPLWLVFELTGTKLPHYVLPVYPALALACAAGLCAAFEQDWKRLRIAARTMTTLVALALAGLCAALAAFMPGDLLAGQKRAVQTGLVALATMAPAIIAGWRAKTPALLAASAAACALIFAFTARERILPRADALFVSELASRALARQGMHPRLSPAHPHLTVLGDNEPSLVFLTRTDTRLAVGQDGAALTQPGEVFLVEGRERAAFESGLAARGLAFSPAGAPVAGLNYANGDAISLQPGRIIAKADAAAP